MCRWSHSLGYLGPCTEHRLSVVSWYCIPTCRNRTFTLSHIQLKQMKKLWYKHDTSFIKQCKFHTTAQRKCIKWWNKHNGNIIQNILWTQIWQNSFAHTRRNHGLIVAFSFCQCLYNACFCVIFLLLGTCFVQFVALLLSVQLSAWNDPCLKRVEWDIKPYLLLLYTHASQQMQWQYLASAMWAVWVKRLYSVEIYSVLRSHDTFLLWCRDLNQQHAVSYMTWNIQSLSRSGAFTALMNKYKHG